MPHNNVSDSKPTVATDADKGPTVSLTTIRQDFGLTAAFEIGALGTQLRRVIDEEGEAELSAACRSMLARVKVLAEVAYECFDCNGEHVDELRADAELRAVIRCMPADDLVHGSAAAPG